jgi:hypothetical protein
LPHQAVDGADQVINFAGVKKRLFALGSRHAVVGWGVHLNTKGRKMLQIGDKITSSGILGIRHAGVYVGPYGAFDHAVVHNSKRDGMVVVEDLSAFGPYGVAQSAPPGRGWSVREAALRLRGTRYDLFTFNCEHFASFVQEGKARSPQLAGGLLLGGVLSLLGLAAGLAPRGTYDPVVDRRRDSKGRFTRR